MAYTVTLTVNRKYTETYSIPEERGIDAQGALDAATIHAEADDETSAEQRTSRSLICTEVSYGAIEDEDGEDCESEIWERVIV